MSELHLQSTGRLAGSTNLNLVIGLPLRNKEAFDQLLQNIYDPASPLYHHYLTPQQIAENFGPTEEDYQAVITYARANGLTVTGTHSDRTLVDVNGAVADIEKGLHVTMRVYQHPTEARTFYATDVEPSVDLSVPLLYISGLNNFTIPHPGGAKGKTSDRVAGAAPGAGSGPGNAYWGNDFRAAYVPGVSLTGSGQAIGLLELDGYYTNDITAYETQAGLPNVTVTNVLVDGFSGTPDGNANWVGEVSLDIEMAIAMAPGLSKVIVYEAPNCCYYWVDILKRMQEDNAAKQLSCSWLFDFDDGNAEACYLNFKIQGQSFFQCSGDYLAFYNGVPQWTDEANVTLVGGTRLTTSGASGSWVSETTWNNGNGVIGSGGGISTSYFGNVGIPFWQQGINMTANHGSTTMRNVPDVAMVAYDAWVISDNGSANWWWGTSIAAPLWAGFTALVNQQAALIGQTTVGFINPAVYTIGKGYSYYSCFHDIMTGNNTNSHSSNLFLAVSGYDLCTGWGSPTGSNLVNNLIATLLVVQNFTATAVNTNQINLSWSAPPGATGYILSRGNRPPATFFEIGTTTATNYSDIGLEMGTEYCYTVVPTFNGAAYPYYVLACATTPLATNLLAYWTFDESGGPFAYDYSGNSNTGSVGFAVGNWTNGMVHGALFFDGQAIQVGVSNSPSLNPVNGISIAAWVKTANWYNTPYILAKGMSDNQYEIFVNGSGQLEFLLAGVTNGTLVCNPPSTNAWHHVAATYDGSQISLYIDGQLVTQQVASGLIPASTDPLVIGAQPTGSLPTNYFHGFLDDLRIYGSAVTPAQVAQLYNIDSIGNGISNWWRMQYFGTGSTTDNTSCATCDFDGTGQNNLFKYVTGLDPTNPSSTFVLQIASVTGQPNRWNLIYKPLAGGRTYSIQSTTNTPDGAYGDLSGFSGPQTNGSQVTITDQNAGQTNKFYRVHISLP